MASGGLSFFSSFFWLLVWVSAVDALQCPVGYNLVEEDMCIPPEGYKGPCSQVVPLDVLDYPYQVGDRWCSDMNWCGMVFPLLTNADYQIQGPCPRFYQWNTTTLLCETRYELPCPTIPGIFNQNDYDLHHRNWSICAVAISGDWSMKGKVPFYGARCPDDWTLNTTSRCRVTLDSQDQCPSGMENFYDYCVYTEDWVTMGADFLRYRRRPHLGCERFPMMDKTTQTPSRLNEMRRCGFNFYCHTFDASNPANLCPTNYDVVNQQCVSRNTSGHPCDILPMMTDNPILMAPNTLIWSRCGQFVNCSSWMLNEVNDGWHCPVQMTPLQLAVPESSFPDSANSNECVQSSTSTSIGKTGKCWSFEPPFDSSNTTDRSSELTECVTSL